MTRVTALITALTLSLACASGTAKAAREPIRVAFLGDSLTVGWGLAPAQAYPALVGARMAASGLAVRVLNAGVSGDTTAQGLARLEGVLAARPDLVVVALGTNDALRGRPPARLAADLEAIVVRCQHAGAHVVLVGMRFGTWIGPERARLYDPVYPLLASRLKLPLVPFLLEGVAGARELCFPDGLHPNALGQQHAADIVSPVIETVVRDLSSHR